MTEIGRRTADGGFDVVEFADATQRFLGNRRRPGDGQFEELAPGMGPTGRLDDGALVARCMPAIQVLEAGVAVGMKDTAERLQVRLWMHAPAVAAVQVADGRRRSAR